MINFLRKSLGTFGAATLLAVLIVFLSPTESSRQPVSDLLLAVGFVLFVLLFLTYAETFKRMIQENPKRSYWSQLFSFLSLIALIWVAITVFPDQNEQVLATWKHYVFFSFTFLCQIIGIFDIVLCEIDRCKKNFNNTLE